MKGFTAFIGLTVAVFCMVLIPVSDVDAQIRVRAPDVAVDIGGYGITGAELGIPGVAVSSSAIDLQRAILLNALLSRRVGIRSSCGVGFTGFELGVPSLGFGVSERIVLGRRRNPVVLNGNVRSIQFGGLFRNKVRAIEFFD